MKIIQKVKKYQKKKAKKAAKEELKQMIPTLRGQLNEVTSGLDELNGLLKRLHVHEVKDLFSYRFKVFLCFL